jgi:hypothetical protein
MVPAGSTEYDPSPLAIADSVKAPVTSLYRRHAS